ncbi:Piso0_004603 [Millerozyma farinosa CBS 7064]|uniref:Piso0_004603 protein n=1 Tax=Pichia sorbitophila (strain ATCC MYA-4447 / BCRC 22081 / CBS 7064 / NBRC 10061 / NRRL Y-12695) TaxID=559304 RepID=G8Y989_PICSO|nr:Piso0_004603 [Millerozyma farinosa CBS 7064]CCE85034.1 Piso0_004603 [Millerozyma farinosa CBS 7064]
MGPRIRRRITSSKREEIEREQQQLSQAIARPFDVLEGLPVSYNSPPYGRYEEVLNNPLTVKDTGVLYRSLMKSRFNYINVGPMFKLYWQKQSAYAKKMQQLDQKKPSSKAGKGDKEKERTPMISSDHSARDIMVKLCDAWMTLGPHEFEVRLFIAKDERSEKRAKKAKDARESGETQSNEPTVKEEKDATGAGPESASAESNAPAPVADNSRDAETSSNKDSNQDSKQKQTTETSNNETDSPHNDKEEDKPQSTPEIETAAEQPAGQDDKSEDAEEGNSLSNKETPLEANKEDTEDPEEGSDIHTDTTKDQEQSASSQTVIESEKKEVQSIAADQSVDKTENASSEKDIRPKPSSEQGSATSSQKNDQHNMSSIENTIMIANLNAIARVDASLNALMKIVASGNATPPQILTFQGFIQRARDMGPQPHHAFLFPNGRLPGHRPQGRPPKEPRERKAAKPKLPKDQRLTAFQEKYLKDATILFEFVENPNVRYMLTRECVCEVTPSDKAVEGEPEVKDVIMSFLWIHNEQEVSNYKEKLKEFEKWEEEQRKKNEAIENQKNSKDEDAKEEKNDGNADQVEDNQESSKDPATSNDVEEQEKQSEDSNVSQKNGSKNARRTGSRRTRKRTAVIASKKSEKKPERPVEPEVRYTPVNLKLQGIPSRYIPIISNSAYPLNEVQSSMSEILKSGIKSSMFYLWYQVDGKVDEQLAEDIRVQSNQEEKKMPGLPTIQSSSTSGSGPRKRRTKEKDPNTQAKRAKPEKAQQNSTPINKEEIQSMNQTHEINPPE